MNKKKHEHRQKQQGFVSVLSGVPLREQQQDIERRSSPVRAYQRLQHGSGVFSPPDLLSLQRTIGNQAIQRQLAPVPSEHPQQEHATSLPASLKANIEALSGFSMDDVTVHYNSSQPAQIQALAYTQGTDIHVGPGEERHLPHEAWHVVQQKQGRVKPTLQVKDALVNDERGLEKEADVMGARAMYEASRKGSMNVLSTTDMDRLDTTSLVGLPTSQRVEKVIQRHPGSEEFKEEHDATKHASYKDRLDHRKLAGERGARMELGGNKEVTRNWLEALDIDTVSFRKYVGRTPDTATTRRWVVEQEMEIGGRVYSVVFDVHFENEQMKGPGSVWVEGLHGSDVIPQDSGKIDILYRRFVEWQREH